MKKRRTRKPGFKTLRWAPVLLALSAVFLCASCQRILSGRSANGYYTAIAQEYDSHGWKEFVSVYFNNGRIVMVEYNARNPSGFIKSWDPDYMQYMNASVGTYPNEYTRVYSTALLNLQDPGKIDVISGATESYHVFKDLARAAIARAQSGNKQVVYVRLKEIPEE